MDREKYQRGISLLIILFGTITGGTVIGVYLCTNDWHGCMVALFGSLFLCGLAWGVYRLDDIYITGVVADLSELTDMLLHLEEKEIFPDNEDTVLSKLQSKIMKLTGILKQGRQRAEREQQELKELVSDISHQLKTPLANLKMYSQFLEDESLSPEKRREYIEVLRVSVERLNFLSENMIKISRLESGLIQMNTKRQSLNETVLKSVKDVYPRAKQKKTEIIYKESGQVILRHDRNWTAEAVFNLLDNAVKYGKHGSSVILSVKRFGMFVQVSVEDENDPIPPEERNKVFKRFYRGRGSQEKDGIGVGLYLAREIVQLQGGYMNLKTTGKGNIFSLMLYDEKSQGERDG